MLTNLIAILWQMLQGFLTVVVPGLAVVGAAQSTPAEPPAPAPIVIPSDVPAPADPWAVLELPEPADDDAAEIEAPAPVEIEEPAEIEAPAPAPANSAPLADSDVFQSEAATQPGTVDCWRVADGIVANGWDGSADQTSCFTGEWDPAIEEAYGALETSKDGEGAPIPSFTTNDVRPCTDEDGSDVGCFWDSRNQGNGQGWSFYVDQDGGITYATADEYVPAGKSPADAPADVPPAQNDNGPAATVTAGAPLTTATGSER